MSVNGISNKVQVPSVTTQSAKPVASTDAVASTQGAVVPTAFTTGGDFQATPIIARQFPRSWLPIEPRPMPVDPPIWGGNPPRLPPFPEPRPFPPEPPILPRPIPIPFPPFGGKQQIDSAEVKLLQATVEAERHPSLQNDVNELQAAKADLQAYERYEPNSPRVAALKAQIAKLGGKITGEVERSVDQALNQWYASGGDASATWKLLQTLDTDENALRQVSPFSPQLEFIQELKQAVQPPLPPIWYLNNGGPNIF